MTSPIITVCVLTRGRSAVLDACLVSLDAQVDPPAWELRLLADGDASVAAFVRERFPEAAVGVFHDARPGGARNLLLDEARGEVLLFLDDDVVVEPHLLRYLADLVREHPDISVFGGPNITPPHSSRFQVVQGAVLGSLVGAGPVRRRYGPHPEGSADERWFTLCNLAVRRSAMQRFSEALVCAEENDVLERLARDGHTMLYDPFLMVFHERRPSFRAFARQMLKYGIGRGQLTRRNPRSLRPAFAAPSALIAYLVALGPAVAVTGPVSLLPGALYLAAVAAEATKVTASVRRPASWPLAAALIVVLHLCYGAGLLRGLVGGGTHHEVASAPRAEWDVAGAPSAGRGPTPGVGQLRRADQRSASPE